MSASESTEGQPVPSSMPNTDDADPAVVLSVVMYYAGSWQPEARLLGNVRAGDIVRACDTAVHALKAHTDEAAHPADYGDDAIEIAHRIMSRFGMSTMDATRLAWAAEEAQVVLDARSRSVPEDVVERRAMALHADVNAHEEWDDVEDMRKDMYRGRARAIAESDAAAGCLLVPPKSLDARVAAAEVVERRARALFQEVFWGFDHPWDSADSKIREMYRRRAMVIERSDANAGWQLVPSEPDAVPGTSISGEEDSPSDRADIATPHR